MQNIEAIKIMNTHTQDYTLEFWVKKLEDGKLEFWVEKLGNPQKGYNENNELIARFPTQFSEKTNDFQEILKLIDDWHFGEPDFKQTPEKYKDIIWREFQDRKFTADESNRVKIERVEFYWARACGKNLE